MDNSKDLSVDEVINRVRVEMSKRGEASFRTLVRTFQRFDKDNSGKLNVEEFEAGLKACGLFLPVVHIKMLIRKFDCDGDGLLSADEFYKALVGKLNRRRLAIVRQAFDKFDKDGSGVVDVEDLKGEYDASRHPAVLAGERTEKEVFEQFLNSFDGIGGNNDGRVTWDEFQSYYSEISSSLPFNDEYFVTMMENAWKIKEKMKIVIDANAEEAKKRDNRFRKIAALIKEKVDQKKKGNTSSLNAAHQMFKFFDIDNSGMLIYDEFVYALERLGVVMPELESRALFAAFDVSNSGRISYDEFVGAVYGKKKQQQEN
eukprot:TRINITY_DN59632_c0_g1_i1.p1 TRINITY_DN59632_c0_g1~~TRINITY_DN59632_c0_g1_i1.p1  ORF type:complete len:333 (-),score=213.76 TRINITY_DN59632_c0_g1_i1:60-1004(-)